MKITTIIITTALTMIAMTATTTEALTRAAALKRAAIKNSATYCAVCSSPSALYTVPTTPQEPTAPAPIIEGGQVVGQ